MQVLSTIEEQGKLTDELRAQIEAAQTLVVVEDLYRPYRPKRRTRATIAKGEGAGWPGEPDSAAADGAPDRGRGKSICKMKRRM